MLNKDKIYKKWMRRCLALAKKGEGFVSPNPLVGAVLLDKDLNFVSEGFHARCGEAHAEVNAFGAAFGKDYKGGVLIVSLEPCSHYGKTPPCADLIAKSGVKTLVIATLDPNPKVAGRGAEKCREAGIEVLAGVLEDEAKQLNEIFFKNQLEKKIFVALKTATTLDGKIATKSGSSKWITGDEARADVQKLRNKYDAILTSSETVLKDNPGLTCRVRGGRSPVRVVLDTSAKTAPASKVYNDDGARVILFTAAAHVNYPKNVEVVRVSAVGGHVDLNEVLEKLYDIGIYSVLVEAGGKLLGAFIEQGLADKLYQYIAPKITLDKEAIQFACGKSIQEISECKNLSVSTVKKLGADLRLECYFL